MIVTSSLLQEISSLSKHSTLLTYLVSFFFLRYLETQFWQGVLPSHFVLRLRQRSQERHRSVLPPLLGFKSPCCDCDHSQSCPVAVAAFIATAYWLFLFGELLMLKVSPSEFVLLDVPYLSILYC